MPDQYMDDPEKDKADMRRGLGELADRLDFDVLLLAHGAPYPSGGREALRRLRRALKPGGTDPTQTSSRKTISVESDFLGPSLRMRV